ncbi:unnamed protein product [Alternaria alternata]
MPLSKNLLAHSTSKGQKATSLWTPGCHKPVIPVQVKSKILDPSGLLVAQIPWMKAFQTSRAEYIPVLRQDFSYIIEPTEHQNELFGATHDTKFRETYYEEMKPVERKYDDVDSPTRHSGRHSSSSSHTAVRSDRSSSTLAADEEEAEDPHDKLSAEKGENTEVDDTERQFDSGYEGGEESQGEGSETSSHTLGRSEGSSCTLGRVKDEYEHTEEGESDDEGDLFAQSYRNGSRK